MLVFIKQEINAGFLAIHRDEKLPKNLAIAKTPRLAVFPSQGKDCKLLMTRLDV